MPSQSTGCNGPYTSLPQASSGVHQINGPGVTCMHASHVLHTQQDLCAMREQYSGCFHAVKGLQPTLALMSDAPNSSGPGHSMSFHAPRHCACCQKAGDHWSSGGLIRSRRCSFSQVRRRSATHAGCSVGSALAPGLLKTYSPASLSSMGTCWPRLQAPYAWLSSCSASHSWQPLASVLHVGGQSLPLATAGSLRASCCLQASSWRQLSRRKHTTCTRGGSSVFAVLHVTTHKLHSNLTNPSGPLGNYACQA